MARAQGILGAIMATAIRERRVLSLTYVGAIEPQLFAPLALYVNVDNRLMVDGYEINGKRVRWRELHIESARRDADRAHLQVQISGNTVPKDLSTRDGSYRAREPIKCHLASSMFCTRPEAVLGAHETPPTYSLTDGPPTAELARLPPGQSTRAKLG